MQLSNFTRWSYANSKLLVLNDSTKETTPKDIKNIFGGCSYGLFKGEDNVLNDSTSLISKDKSRWWQYRERMKVQPGKKILSHNLQYFV